MLRISVVAALALSTCGCSKYSSYLDCLNAEMKGKTETAQLVAIAYCKKHYKMTDQEQKLLRGY